jgi:hypothetical protein
MHTKNDIPMASIRTLIASGAGCAAVLCDRTEFPCAGRPVIANVMKGGHFVLVVGWDTVDSDTLYINDPGFDRQTYSYASDVVGWRLFQMNSTSTW